MADSNSEQEVNASGKRVLCRTENYADCHEGLGGLLRSDRLLHILEQLSGEPMLLFKEKINYKLAGSGTFLYHALSRCMTNILRLNRELTMVQVVSLLTSMPSHILTSR